MPRPSLSYFLLTLFAFAAPPQALADRLRDLVRQGAPTIVIVEEVDRLMTSEPGCATAALLTEILPEALAAPGGSRILFRVARHLEDLGCTEAEGLHLKDLLRRRAEELGVLEAYLRLAVPLGTGTPAGTAPAAELRLQVRTGFRAQGGLRASLSPSGRYLAVGSLLKGGSITVWDLHTGYEQRALSESLTVLSAFLTDQSLLVAGLGGVSLWDFTTNRQVLLASSFLESPTFLAVSPERRFVALSNRRGRLQVFRVTGAEGGPVGLALHSDLEGEEVQTGVFTNDHHLLLGTADWRLLDFDLERGQIAATCFVGDPEDIPMKITGDLNLDVLRVLQGGLSGVRNISVSPDASLLAVTTDRQVVLVSRRPGELMRQRDLKADPAYQNALFVGNELVVWSHRTAVLLPAGDPQRDPRPGPDEIRTANWGAVLAGSTALFVGGGGYVIYDFERRAAHPRSVQSAPTELGLGTRLLGDRFILYSSGEGLQEVNLYNLRDAIAESQLASAPVHNIYRGGLLGTIPPSHLHGLGRFRKDLYWLEFHERPFLVVLSPGARSDRTEAPLARSPSDQLPLVSYLPLPATVEPIPSSWKNDSAVAEQLKPFRTMTWEGIPARLHVDFDGLARGPLAEMVLTLRGYERVAFNGAFVAVTTEAGVEVLPVAGGGAWRIPHLGMGCKVAFHPVLSGLLAVWAEDGALEAWNVIERRRLWKVVLPPEPPRRLLFDGSGELLVLASRAAVTVVEFDAGRARFRHAFGGESNIFGLAIDHASTRLLVTGDFGGKDLALADLVTGKVQTLLVGGFFGLFSEAGFWEGEQPGILEINISSPELGLYRVQGDRVEKALSLAFFGGEAVAFDPTNRFWSTLEGGRSVAVDYGGYVGALEQLGSGSSFRDPGTVLAAFDGKPTAPPPRSPTPPQVFVLDQNLSPFARRTLEEGRLTVRLAVRAVVPVQELRIYVNGARHLTLPPVEEVKLDGLGQGHNEISIVAVDLAGNASLPANFSVRVRASREPLPRLFFLAIGAGDRDLHDIPGRNAKALSERFAALPKGTVWSAIDSQVLVDPHTTGEEIHAAVARVRDEASARDMLILYLSGHGRRGLTPGSWSFVTAGGDVSLDELGQWLAQVSARVLLLLDTCYGGELAPLGPLGHDAMTARLLARRDVGIAVLAASKSWQPTWAWPDSGRSTFATALESAFEPMADLNQDGVISLREFQLVVGAQAELLAGTEFQARMDRLRHLAKEGAFQLATRDLGVNLAFRHDEVLWETIHYPHRPWLHGLEDLGDIPLLPVH